LRILQCGSDGQAPYLGSKLERHLYPMSAFAAIRYAEHATYVVFAATGSRLNAFASLT
jgi:hypothetical protein